MDYEELILIKQDLIEIYEDEPDSAECLIGKCWWMIFLMRILLRSDYEI